MTAPLDGAQRTALGNLIQKARSLLDADLASTLEGDFGIHRSDGRIEEVHKLSLDASQAAVRIDLLDIVAFLRSEGETELAAVERLIREAAFTHVNRLVSLRVAEGLGVLPEAIGRGLASQGFRDFAEVAPASADEEWERFRLLVRICADELSADVPALFDPRNPLLELEPSTAAFSELIELFVAVDATIWSAPDALGWSYQFFNSAEERKEMRKSRAPRNSRELAVRNQFFTPSYVVEFLVQNTLGAQLAASYPALAGELPLLVEVPKPNSQSIDLRDVSALDPACGSGHFLLGAYDILEAAWRHAGVQPDEAAPDIVHSLWGIDIDPRASQIAQSAIIFRARRHCPGVLPKPNVICARSLPRGPLADAIIDELPDHVGRVVRAIADNMDAAPVLGSLLTLENLFEKEMQDLFGTGETAGTLAEAFDATDVANEALSALSTVADASSSSPVERMFVADAEDAVRLVGALRRRYSAVLMNPPYGLAVEAFDKQLRRDYPDTWTDLYAAMVQRGLSLLSGDGLVGALTSSTFFTGRKLREWRSSIVRSHRPTALVDLGGGVLDGAANQTAMWVIPRSRSTGDTTYADATSLDEDQRAAAISAHALPYVHKDPGALTDIRNSPFALHVPDGLIELWVNGETLEPRYGEVRSGCTTFDDFRFVRCWWEVKDPGSVSGWDWFEKGGEFQPFISPTRLVVNWMDSGRELREFTEAKGNLAQALQSSTYWRRSGIACPNISSVGFCARLMAPGQIFSARTLAVFLEDDGTFEQLLWILNSTVVSQLLEVFGRTRTTDNGAVKAIPVAPFSDDLLTRAKVHQKAAIKAVLAVERLDERSPLFHPGTLGQLNSPSAARSFLKACHRDLVEARSELDRLAAEGYGVETSDADLRHGLKTLENWRRRVDFSDPEEWRGRIASLLFGRLFCRFDDQDAQPGEFDVQGFLERPLESHLSVGGGHRGAPLVCSDDTAGRSDLLENLERLAIEAEVDESFFRSDKGGPGGSIRAYIRQRFFADHLKLYSYGARKAPIYWQLQVPSKTWGVWLYTPRLSREVLFAVVRETGQRQRLAEQRIATLQREYEDGGAGRSVAAVSKELDAEQKLSVELVAFRDEAERIANLGWEPDLDDGAVLNAAPLASLFPAWKDAAKYREELKHGKYTWSTVAKYADQL